MKEYIYGLAFNLMRNKVLLIRYSERKISKFNAIGRILNEEEDSQEAIIDHFYQKTGIYTEDWEYFLEYVTNKNTCLFFRAFTDEIFNYMPEGEDSLVISSMHRLPEDVFFNIKWLVPLALDHHVRPLISIKGV